MVPVEKSWYLESHSSSTAARVYWAGIRRDRSSGVGTAVATAAAAATAASSSSSSSSSSSINSSREGQRQEHRGVVIQHVVTSIAISQPPTRLHVTERGEIRVQVYGRDPRRIWLLPGILEVCLSRLREGILAVEVICQSGGQASPVQELE